MGCIALPAGCEEFQQIPATAMPEWWRAEGIGGGELLEVESSDPDSLIQGHKLLTT